MAGHEPPYSSGGQIMFRLAALITALLCLSTLPQWRTRFAPAPGGQQVEAIAQAGKNLAAKGCKSILGRAQEFTCNVGSTGYQTCREYLKSGVMRKCYANFWEDTPKVTSKFISASQLKIHHISSARITVAANKRGWGTKEGSASFTAYFPVPQRPALTPAECFPGCITAGSVGCDRSCSKKEQFLMRTTG